MALFAFNLGVEAGQLLFIALVLSTGILIGRLFPLWMQGVNRPGGEGSVASATESGARGGLVRRANGGPLGSGMSRIGFRCSCGEHSGQWQS